ncbi:MAG TPA: STAS domain-containing protein [Janthinobacterium sp.]|jgi:phospholipid transport system transporter-binding protein|nr:STAS domain-containing protein [Janthinobacterium sp.]
MPDALDTFQSLTTLNVLNAKSALEQGLAAIKAGQTVFDLRNVTAVDSAAVSVMLAWQRAAHAAGFKLKLENLPTNLKNLTKLYGVCSLVSSALACGEVDAPATVAADTPAKPATMSAGQHHH